MYLVVHSMWANPKTRQKHACLHWNIMYAMCCLHSYCFLKLTSNQTIVPLHKCLPGKDGKCHSGLHFQFHVLCFDYCCLFGVLNNHAAFKQNVSVNRLMGGEKYARMLQWLQLSLKFIKWRCQIWTECLFLLSIPQCSSIVTLRVCLSYRFGSLAAWWNVKNMIFLVGLIKQLLPKTST